ncbi:hypothetical protein IKU74_02760 [bacterium]|nr:hypothetical protein [bacterium]
MKIKIILITLIILITVISGIFVLNIKDTVKVTLQCKDAEIGCTYTEFDKPVVETHFKYEDVLQCSIETIMKTVKDEYDEEMEETDCYELLVITKNNTFRLEHKNVKSIAMICAKIFDKKPFEITTKNRKQ